MKKYSIILISLIFLFSCTLKKEQNFRIGQKSITYVDKSRNRQLCHWFNVSEKLGNGVAEGLNVKIDAVINGNRK